MLNTQFFQVQAHLCRTHWWWVPATAQE